MSNLTMTAEDHAIYDRAAARATRYQELCSMRAGDRQDVRVIEFAKYHSMIERACEGLSVEEYVDIVQVSNAAGRKITPARVMHVAEHETTADRIEFWRSWVAARGPDSIRCTYPMPATMSAFLRRQAE